VLHLVKGVDLHERGVGLGSVALLKLLQLDPSKTTTYATQACEPVYRPCAANAAGANPTSGLFWSTMSRS